VRTSAPVPKNQVVAICRQLSALCIHVPVKMGQVIVTNVAGTGCDVIATRDMTIVRTDTAENCVQ
jgi:CxxC motif-containing protein